MRVGIKDTSMFATKSTVVTMAKSSRMFSTLYRKEVLISQSRDLLSNTALEDWAARNKNLKEKSVLILSNNITRSKNIEIKATLLDVNTYWKVQEFDSLVLSSLSPELPLKKLPDLQIYHEAMDQSSCSYSIYLELSKLVRTKVVLETLETIGKNFLKEDEFEQVHDCPTHLSLVRPDDGWFPGIQEIRNNLKENFEELREDQESFENCDTSMNVASECNLLQNSFGHV